MSCGREAAFKSGTDGIRRQLDAMARRCSVGTGDRSVDQDGICSPIFPSLRRHAGRPKAGINHHGAGALFDNDTALVRVGSALERLGRKVAYGGRRRL